MPRGATSDRPIPSPRPPRRPGWDPPSRPGPDTAYLARLSYTAGRYCHGPAPAFPATFVIMCEKRAIAPLSAHDNEANGREGNELGEMSGLGRSNEARPVEPTGREAAPVAWGGLG